MRISRLSKKLKEPLIIILCTIPNNKKTSLKLIQILLNCKLAACITLLNKTHSFYYWNNKMEIQTEYQLLIKTKSSLKKAVFNKIKELHPYKVPELLAVPIIFSEKNYSQWIYAQLQPKQVLSKKQ